MGMEVDCCGTRFALYVLIVIGLVCFAGLMAGLTLGLMSLGSSTLRFSSSLVVLRIVPMLALPIFLDALVPPWAAILLSVTLILMFGEEEILDETDE